MRRFFVVFILRNGYRIYLAGVCVCARQPFSRLHRPAIYIFCCYYCCTAVYYFLFSLFTFSFLFSYPIFIHPSPWLPAQSFPTIRRWLLAGCSHLKSVSRLCSSCAPNQILIFHMCMNLLFWQHKQIKSRPSPTPYLLFRAYNFSSAATSSQCLRMLRSKRPMSLHHSYDYVGQSADSVCEALSYLRHANDTNEWTLVWYLFGCLCFFAGAAHTHTMPIRRHLN